MRAYCGTRCIRHEATKNAKRIAGLALAEQSLVRFLIHAPGSATAVLPRKPGNLRTRYVGPLTGKALFFGCFPVAAIAIPNLYENLR